MPRGPPRRPAPGDGPEEARIHAERDVHLDRAHDRALASTAVLIDLLTRWAGTRRWLQSLRALPGAQPAFERLRYELEFEIDALLLSGLVAILVVG